MYCPYCKEKGMMGATRCHLCGRPLTGGKSPYDTGRGGNTKIAVIALVSVVVIVIMSIFLISAGTPRGESSRGSMRNEQQESKRPGRKDPEKEILIEQTEPEEEIRRPAATQPKETEPAETKPAETLPPETQPNVKKVEGFSIYSYRDLKDKIGPDCIAEEIQATFRYLGSEGELDYEDVCNILSARAASVRKLDSGEYRITALPYAGARILKAYRSGDIGTLTKDEQEALRIAEQVVDKARKEANSDWELELMLHDWMCENISYYDVDFSIEFTEKRPLNVIGALLDGKANCQGYTDCFYLLGSMAGFVVDKQSEDDHTFNTIKQGGNWYIVDVTHDDTEVEMLGKEFNYYQFLNAGLADCDGRTWKSYCERNPVAKASGSYFYYEQLDLGEAHSYQKTFYSLQEAARSVLKEYQNGRKTHQILVRGTEVNYDAMNNTLNQEANKMGVTYTVWTWAKPVNGNTFFTIYFE